MTSRSHASPKEEYGLSRRRFLRSASAGVAGSAVANAALANSLADVPPREPGAPLSGHSERSQYVRLSRIPEAGPGLRHVDPNDAINSKTPLNKTGGFGHADGPALRAQPRWRA